MRVGRSEGPKAERVIEGTGHEGIPGRAEGERRDRGGMALEVSKELVVVRGEVADCVVAFGRGVDDGLGVVSEAGQVGAIFLGEKRFDMAAFFGIIELKGLVAAGGQEKLAQVVKGEGGGGGFGFAKSEELQVY